MDDLLRTSLLFDFYGELLTKHQKEVYENIVFNDFSISEVARDSNISRQSVHDMIKRCSDSLEKYESRLHLVEKFINTKNEIKEIQKIALNIKETNDLKYIDDIIEMSEKILKDI